MNVPFLNLQAQYQALKKEIDNVVQNIFDNNSFILGKPVKDFEDNISKYLNIKALGCASGSEALLLALLTSKIKAGDEVITTPFTFFATAGAIARLGAIPVFVDVEKEYYNIDVTKIEEKISKRTKAILPVHLFGHPVDMDPLMEIAAKNNLIVIEDACQAIGAEYKGKKVGSIGDFGCFSFYPTKNLGGAGDGGLITTNNDDYYEYLSKLRVHGSGERYMHDFVGINSRLDALQAAVLNVKLQKLEEWNENRRKIGQKYTKELSNLVDTPKEANYAKHIYHQYALLTDKRDDLFDYLKSKDIGVGIYYPVPLHLQNCFKELGYKKGDLPVSEMLSEKILSLPMFETMSEEQADYVISNIKDFFN